MKNSSWGRLLGGLAALTLLPACKPSVVSTQVQYGFLGGEVSSTLLSLRPGEAVLVCGSDSLRLLALEAIRTWSAAAGRDFPLKSEASCARRSQFSASLELASEGSSCGPRSLGFNRTLSPRHALIVLCPLSWNQGQDVRPVVLHEAGHSFGLCDQYPSDPSKPWVSFHANCQSRMQSATAQYSVMNGGSDTHPKTLTDDDRVAVRLFACRADVAGNKEWMERLGSRVDGWKTPLFRAEIRRLQASYLFLPECLVDAVQPAAVQDSQAVRPFSSCLEPPSGNI